MHLTHQGSDPHTSEVSTKAEEIGEPEIEITPAMIAAGVNEFLDFDSRFEHDFGELVASIYEVMERAKATA